MALSKSEKSFLPSSALAALALAALAGCVGKDGSASGGGGGAARACEPALSGGAAVRGLTAAYWTVDRIEDGAADGEEIAVLENSETLLTEERPLRELPAGVREGLALTDGGAAGTAPAADTARTAARAAAVSELFERLKAGAVP